MRLDKRGPCGMGLVVEVDADGFGVMGDLFVHVMSVCRRQWCERRLVCLVVRVQSEGWWRIVLLRMR